MTLLIAEFFKNNKLTVVSPTQTPKPGEVPQPVKDPSIYPSPPEIMPVPEEPTNPRPGVAPEVSPFPEPPGEPEPDEIPPDEEPEEEPDED